MMRALLDRLLFALPSPPSRASLVRGGLYLLFGLLLYGLFLGILYVRELGVVGLRQWCGRLPGVQMDMSRPELSFFPPGAAAERPGAVGLPQCPGGPDRLPAWRNTRR